MLDSQQGPLNGQPSGVPREGFSFAQDTVARDDKGDRVGADGRPDGLCSFWGGRVEYALA